jgi:hypothetical protein
VIVANISIINVTATTIFIIIIVVVDVFFQLDGITVTCSIVTTMILVTPTISTCSDMTLIMLATILNNEIHECDTHNETQSVQQQYDSWCLLLLLLLLIFLASTAGQVFLVLVRN